MRDKIKVVYVTSSEFKRQEIDVLLEHQSIAGKKLADTFSIEIRQFPIRESLDVDLEAMVKHEVRQAYSQLRVPCIVEHAGLILEEYADNSFPGGLTKPMWDTLKANFIKDMGWANKRAIARAVVAYCDGMAIHTFTGETRGTLADSPRGKREFYWDTVFIPDTTEAQAGQTFAEICDDPELGLDYKMKSLSQSGKALMGFFKYRLEQPTIDLWDI